MAERPVILDLYCGAGGAAVGYDRAGFRVVGVDILPQPDYPFEFIHSDALWYVRRFGRRYDYIHASPPCQAYSRLTRDVNRHKYPKLVPDTRQALQEIGRPYIIENVDGAPLRPDITLCGEMFGLRVIRHRNFELGGWRMPQPEHPPHRGVVTRHQDGVQHDGYYMGVYGHGGGKGSLAQWQQAMGIDWTNNRDSIAEAIPPAYTQYIGSNLIPSSSLG